MTSTDTTQATIRIPGIGNVPALPAELHPVAQVATDVPLHAWGVVISVSDGAAPILVHRAAPNQVVARRWAYAILAHPDRAYLVQRSEYGVTVHTLDIGHRGNTLGSVRTATLAEHQPTTPACAAWEHLVFSTTDDYATDAEHHLNIRQAQRIAHGLPIDATPKEILHAVMSGRLAGIAYLTAYTTLIGARDALHTHAQHRLHPTHRPA